MAGQHRLMVERAEVPAAARSGLRLRIGAALPLIGVWLLACGGDRDAGSDAGLERGGTAVVCAPAVPALNPFSSPDQLAADLRPLLFSPLVLYGEDEEFRPNLAQSWEWSDDARSVTFRLRDDVQWHDGRPVTAEDVAWTLRTAADPRFAYHSGGDFGALESVDVQGVAVTARFAEPFVFGLEPFVVLPILPRHLLGDIAPEQFASAPYNQEPVGSGPFRFVRRSADGMILLERVESYPSELGTPGIDRLFLRAITEPSALVIELQTGGVDACITGSSLAGLIAGDSTLRAVTVDPVGVQAIPLDSRVEPFTDVRVRRAFSAALDRQALAAVVSPLARPAPTYLPASSPVVSTSWAQPDGNLELARALLDSAGWTPGRDGIRTNAQGQPLRFTLMGPQQYQAILTAVQAQLREAGFAPDIQLLEAATFFATIRNPDSRPAAMALAFFPEKLVRPDPRPQLHSTGGSNLGSYSSIEVDRLIESLRDVASATERTQVYAAIQRHVAEDVPAVYTIQIPRMMAVGPRLEGVETDRNGPFGSVAGWRVKSR